ncbi:MAG: diguanylate cyclase, partial [Rhizobacter sp.]|nr:diguanylate cyclase [Rhizobacter sp.]
MPSPIRLTTAPPPAAAVRQQDALSRLQRHLVAAALAVLAVMAAVTWLVVDHGHHQLIEYKALTLAEVVARQAASSRSTYTEHVAGKLTRDGSGRASADYATEPGNVPLPAQFLKLVGMKASAESDGLYRYRPISKWNLGEGQHLRDDFQRWAWAKLEAQDRGAPDGPIAWKSVSRVELIAGESTMRVLRADPAASMVCVECHNRMESSAAVRALRSSHGVGPGKQWRQHQLLGALEVQVPLAPVEALARQQRERALTAVVGLASSGFLVLGALLFVGTGRARKLTEQLAWQAGHDNLTGLMNRRQFEQRLQALLDTPGNGGHALMFMDLDQFKVVNDSCGHQAGDELLRQLSEHLKSVLRSTDLLARLGGDEFGVLLADCPLERSEAIADKLLQATGDFRFAWTNRVFEVGISIGLVAVKGRTHSVAELMSAADMACYAAKEAGRHRVRIFHAGDDEVARRRDDMAWGERVAQAMAEGRVTMAVQTARALDPRLGVQNYQELLLRATHADGSPMATGPLIAAAERHPLMSGRIDRWVLQQACSFIRSGRLRADASHIVALNISARSLCDEAFLDFARDAVTGSGIDPRTLCFEITETAAIANLRLATAFITTLKALGCRFALDDFGSGL